MKITELLEIVGVFSAAGDRFVAITRVDQRTATPGRQ